MKQRKMSDAHRKAISNSKKGKPLGKVISRQTKYKLVSPTGKISFVDSYDLPRFLKNNGLSYPTMMRHVKSEKAHRGWLITRI